GGKRTILAGVHSRLASEAPQTVEPARNLVHREELDEEVEINEEDDETPTPTSPGLELPNKMKFPLYLLFKDHMRVKRSLVWKFLVQNEEKLPRLLAQNNLLALDDIERAIEMEYPYRKFYGSWRSDDTDDWMDDYLELESSTNNDFDLYFNAREKIRHEEGQLQAQYYYGGKSIVRDVLAIQASSSLTSKPLVWRDL
ncbi:hypothetical protein H5410_065048, partial [Solanum commersonii]